MKSIIQRPGVIDERKRPLWRGPCIVIHWQSAVCQRRAICDILSALWRRYLHVRMNSEHISWSTVKQLSNMGWTVMVSLAISPSTQPSHVSIPVPLRQYVTGQVSATCWVKADNVSRCWAVSVVILIPPFDIQQVFIPEQMAGLI